MTMGHLKAGFVELVSDGLVLSAVCVSAARDYSVYEVLQAAVETATSMTGSSSTKESPF